jgi:hypothetical protein
MKKTVCLFLCFLFPTISVFAPSLEASSPGDLFKPLKVDNPPVIDGKLDEPVWAAAPSVTGFKTYSPDYGLEMAEKTAAYMVYDSENLYFGFQCFDRRPELIKASLSKRDDIRPDDWVCVNLDSFNDQQSLYAFYINPLGIQTDSRYASGKEDFSVDVIWYSAGRIDDKGYTVEVQIPLKSIRFAHGQKTEMGIIFERRISRRSEQGTYPPLKPERGFFFLTQMAPMEFYGLKKYTLLEVLPAYTHSQKYSLDEDKLSRDRPEKDVSLTGKYGITSSLILDGTYNPDFSQVEADAGQVDVNLRYDLFFPEKRPFFLEGNELFTIAGASTDNPLQSLVHTRKIIDPKAGFKLTGKIGKRDTIASIFAVDESPAAEEIPEPNAHFSVIRYKRALTQDSFIGLIYTGREQDERYNRVFGSDGQIRLSQSSVLNLHAFGSFSRESDESPEAEGHVFGADYFYDTRKLEVSLAVQDISQNFQTDTGYIIRTGLGRFSASFVPKFYPRSRFLRRIAPAVYTSQLEDHPSGLYETENSLSLNFVAVSSARLTLGYIYSTEVFLARRFETSGWTVQTGSQITKYFTFSITLRNGKAIRYSETPFQARGTRATSSLVFQPSEKINLTLNLTYSDLYRESDSEKIYDYSIVRAKMTYQVNKYLFFRGIAEYNSYRRQMLTDLLASFTYIPGTVIQFGYGSLYQKTAWEDGAYVDSNRFFETKRGLFFKASYLWRL